MSLHAIERTRSRQQRRVHGLKIPRHRAVAATEIISRRWRWRQKFDFHTGDTEPTGDIKLVLRALDLDALRELVKSIKDDDWSLKNIRDALDVVDMDDPREDELRAAIAVLLDHAAEVRELRGDDDDEPSYAIGSAGARLLERQDRKEDVQRAPALPIA